MAQYWDGKANEFVNIPDAELYVCSNDRFMSSWGPAAGKINTCVVPCTCMEMANAVIAYIESRKDQKYIRICSTRPRAKSHVLYSLLPAWIDRAREYSHLMPKYIDW